MAIDWASLLIGFVMGALCTYGWVFYLIEKDWKRLTKFRTHFRVGLTAEGRSPSRSER